MRRRRVAGARRLRWRVPGTAARLPPAGWDARGLGEQRLAAFLERNGDTGRRPARELLQRLRSGAEGRAGELEIVARRRIVLALVSALEPIVARISGLRIRDPPRPPSAPRWAHVPLAGHRPGLVAVRREHARRDRRLAADSPATARSPLTRPMPRRRRIRQSQTRPVPLSLRSPPPRRFDALAHASRRHNPWAADTCIPRARGAPATHTPTASSDARGGGYLAPLARPRTYDPTRHTARQRITSADA